MTQAQIDFLQEKFEQGLLLCRKCENFYPIEKFNKGPQENFGYRYQCKSCDASAYQKEKQQGTANVTVKKKNRELKAKYVALLGGQCHKCGYKESVSALEFHHIDPTVKQYSSTLIYRREDANEEIDKCCLLCANCHKTYTAKEWIAVFIKREGLGYTIQDGTIQYGDYWMPQDKDIYDLIDE